jgi:hypothetical protein
MPLMPPTFYDMQNTDIIQRYKKMLQFKQKTTLVDMVNELIMKQQTAKENMFQKQAETGLVKFIKEVMHIEFDREPNYELLQTILKSCKSAYTDMERICTYQVDQESLFFSSEFFDVGTTMSR